ncbi:MAG: rhomboid family intramembrane serine protease [Thermodesulfobacteriota bacterium]
MQPHATLTPAGFGGGLTRLGKTLLLVYVGIYVIELLVEHWLGLPLVETLAMFPLTDPRFHPFQVITHPFIQPPQFPVSFLFSCLAFYFIAAPVEHAMGRRRFLILFFLAALGGAVPGLIFSMVPGLDQPFMGMVPSILALMVVFGLLNPEATMLLMFILPVKARYISYGTALITLLTFLAKTNPAGAYHLGGILMGYAYFKGFGNLHPILRLRSAYGNWQYRRRRARFTVIDGRKRDDEPKKPTIH